MATPMLTLTAKGCLWLRLYLKPTCVPRRSLAYLTALKEVIQYAGISDVKMEEGSMRVDANISLRPYGQEKFGTKTELKNLNSFSNVRKGLWIRSPTSSRNPSLRWSNPPKHVVTMKPTRQPSSCVSRKGLQTTATSQNQTYHSLKSQMSGLRKCVLNCQSFQKNAVRLRIWPWLVRLRCQPVDCKQSHFWLLWKSCCPRWRCQTSL